MNKKSLSPKDRMEQSATVLSEFYDSVLVLAYNSKSGKDEILYSERGSMIPMVGVMEIWREDFFDRFERAENDGD